MQREIQNQKYHLISGFTKFYVSVKCDCEMELGNLDWRIIRNTIMAR